MPILPIVSGAVNRLPPCPSAACSRRRRCLSAMSSPSSRMPCARGTLIKALIKAQATGSSLTTCLFQICPVLPQTLRRVGDDRARRIEVLTQCPASPVRHRAPSLDATALRRYLSGNKRSLDRSASSVIRAPWARSSEARASTSATRPAKLSGERSLPRT